MASVRGGFQERGVSLRVAVACEDHTLDQFVLKPVIERALTHLGKPHARVQMVTNPRLGGLGDLRRELCGIIDRWLGMSDVIVVALDADCDDARRQSFSDLLDECEASTEHVILVVAIQELEVWLLWGQRSSIDASWTEIREECHPKERFLAPLLTPADLAMPDRGRKRLIADSLAAGWQSICAGCQELADLTDGLREVVG